MLIAKEEQDKIAVAHLNDVHDIWDSPESGESPGELLITMRANGECNHFVKGFDN